jgi:ABC-type uncharacterized transport system fused permease/ATPase subunit
MRDNRLFFNLIVQTAVVSFARSCLMAVTFWMRIRVGIVWREHFTRVIHDEYLDEKMVFYKQQSLRDGTSIADPEERLARDIERTTDELGDLLYSVVYSIMVRFSVTLWGAFGRHMDSHVANTGCQMGAYSTARLGYFVGMPHVVFSIVYSWFSIRVRELIVSGAKSKHTHNHLLPPPMPEQLSLIAALVFRCHGHSGADAGGL